MRSDDLAKRLLATFVEELDEQLSVLNTDLLALEREPGDAEGLRSVFRVAHTLKGASRAAGIGAIEDLCHALEGALANARDGRVPLTPAQLSLGFSAADALASASTQLRSGETIPASAFASLVSSIRNQTPLPSTPSSRRVTAASPASTPMPTAPAVAHAASSPAPAAAHSEPAKGDNGVIDARAAPASGGRESTEQVRVAARQLDGLVAAAGELLGISASLADRPPEVAALRDAVSRWRSRWKKGLARRREAPAAIAGPHAESIAEEIDRSMQELTRDLAALSRRIASDAHAAEITSARLIDASRRLRQRPFAEATEPLPRTARDIAARLGKDVRLVVTGQDVVADRIVLEALREPLLHLVRNAIDHGVETPADRERKGKPRTATIEVSATLRGDAIHVSVADDGTGLDITAIRAAIARRGGRVPETDRDAALSLFSGNLSTRREATEISGRGVGLDIVRAAVEAIGGTVDVQWVAGGGTTFILDAPLSVATMRLLLVCVDNHHYAIPTAFVDRVARVGGDTVARVDGRVVLIDGTNPIPVVSLARLLGPPLTDRPVGDSFPIAQLVIGNRRIAVVVDELVEERELAVRPIDFAGDAGARYVGAALLRDGAVAPVIHVAALVDAALATGGTRSGVTMVATAKRRRAHVLVSDDSITTRTLEQSLLSAAGYEVTTAVDGADAWRVVQAGGIDLVVTDVEMPRMTGIELCEQIRASQAFAALPVILVTSLDLPEQRMRGMEAGADAYITKSSFDQDTLLDTVRQLLGTET
jgi:two-component system chemotaxis sensor kinase CheA